ncbi:hypothetical protein BDY19DRAFT_925149 [Irpex rosettiformis]|uniref:Uncharacterized protein n=1 Tax=Irpex rosettiformis TaxID=378272 RepID=A0ACB8UE92_9APHY|nr:hypothetical protein BDY19DRAFT_925149 [Irpex rosettiformis]
MKSIRKSFGNNKEAHISSPLPPLSKPALAIQPPLKVIRALQSHKSLSPHQLSFEKGDFFHVVAEPKDGQWYEANNPSTGARGLVPVHMFEEFLKGSATPRTPLPSSVKRSETPTSPKSQTFYAVVLHDFAAERADELDARAGDAITVVAQSNREWLVAKPIGKLGRPGLIPVAFVEIRDPTTGEPVRDVDKLIGGGALPPVEEWKRQIMSYKANSISLGVLDENAFTQSSPASSERKSAALNSPDINVQGPTPSSHAHQQAPEETSAPSLLPDGILVTADVKSFHFEMDEYWFRVHAVFQPYDSGSLPPAKELVLFRSYNDFYDFQVGLLEAFPREAGRQGSERMLPYMPGPVPHVDNQITMSRRQELDQYLQELCALPEQGVRGVIESVLVREFFAMKPGDASADIEPQVRYIESLPHSDRTQVGADAEYGVHDRFSRMRLSGGPDSGYEESEYMVKGRNSSAREYDQRPGHYRTESTASMYKNGMSRNTVHSRSSSRNHSLVDHPNNYGHGRNGSSLEIDTFQANAYPRSSTSSLNDRSPIRSSTAPSIASSQGRTPSSANPPISSSIPQTAFIKIKIFDKVSDDLVAIRVHPRVTHSQLMNKVQARLGDGVMSLRYRDSINNALIDLTDDEELRLWLDNTDRLVLYADSE